MVWDFMLTREKFDFGGFYKALSSTVEVRQTTWRAVSKETGVSQSTLSRMSKGRQPDASSLAALSAWSGLNPVDFTSAPKHPSETVVRVAKLLREDPDLDDRGTEALEAIIKTAYANFKRSSSPG